MSGVVGGEFDSTVVREMVEGIAGPGDDEREIYGSDGVSIGVTRPAVDKRGVSCWSDANRAGVVYGVITNLGELSASLSDVFESLFEDPTGTLADLEGGFLVAGYDSSADRQLVATDKLGARECYVTESGGFAFSTDLAALVSQLDDVAVDRQAVNDMLLVGHMWGNRTLVEGVRTVRPATVVEVTDGDRSAERYWKPSYEQADPGDEYLSELVRRYRQAVERTSRTFPAEAGLWLSGGLDSRTTAAALLETIPSVEFESLDAYTYDANPPTNDNPRLARKIAEILDIGFTEVPLTAETFGDCFEAVIESVDGMIQWNTVVNLSTTFAMDSRPPVMIEGMQGELVGDHLLRPHVQNVASPVESQFKSEAAANPETVAELLTADVDPLLTFREEVEATGESEPRKQILDIHFRNYYSRKTLASNRIMRNFVGTRTPHADGDYLEWCSRLPSRYRKGAFPFTDGKVPYETTRAKLALCRRVAPELSNVTYERTKVRPSLPYPLHVLGFVTNVAVGRLRSEPTYGSGQLSDFWIRDESTRLHDRVVTLLDDARRRELFDADAVSEVYTDHMSGTNNAGLIARITTLEHWLQEHVD